MTKTITTIRIDIDRLPEHLDRSRLNTVAASIKEALQDAGIKTEASDLFSPLKIEVPTAQLAAASAVLAELQLI